MENEKLAFFLFELSFVSPFCKLFDLKPPASIQYESEEVISVERTRGNGAEGWVKRHEKATKKHFPVRLEPVPVRRLNPDNLQMLIINQKRSMVMEEDVEVAQKAREKL